ncbi:hypothetical protein C5167_002590 [Papaver somniferum]|uniref:Uncharacterized protein n=1 Tax=Papaver somniferum TaxID=3469 RepID=A0A4Y7KZ46_PAPSO|nr:hypothetical protein C5167_002590 [Papaver somniferum]
MFLKVEVLVRGHKDLQLKDDQVDDENTSELEQEEKEIRSLCWASFDGSILAVGYADGDIFLWNLLSASSIKGRQAGGSSNDAALSLECSSGKEAIRCVNRQEKTPLVRAILFPVVVPMAEPHMTVAKLCLVPMEGHSSKALLETSLNLKATLYAGTKWPLTGGISQKLPFSEDDGVERVYIAGYKDGSVQLWNATYSVLSPIVALEGEKIEVSGASSPASALDFCFLGTSLVRIYRLCNSEETSFHFVPENNQSLCPVHSLHQVKGLQCIAAFCILNSPIRSLQYVDSGAELVVGFECGQVAMLDMSSLSVLFLKDCVSGSSSPKSPKGDADVEQIENKDSVDGQVFILTRDFNVLVLESVTDNSSLASEASTGEHSEPLSKDSAIRSEQLSEDGFTLVGVNPQIEIRSSRESRSSGKRSLDSLANGSKLAFITFLASESDSRISDFLPCLYDKVLVAAADAAIRFSSSQKKNREAPDIIKGFKGEKGQTMDSATSPSSDFRLHLESIFSSIPFPYTALDISDFEDVEELNIDDIEINKPVRVPSTSSYKSKKVPLPSTASYKSKNGKGGKDKDGQKLFEVAPPKKPKLRTPAEICTLDFGDEYGMMSVLKYDAEEAAILQLPYHIPAKNLADAAGVSLPDHISVVGVLPQPCTSGNRQDILKLSQVSKSEQDEKEISSLCWASPDESILAVGYVDGGMFLWNMLSASSIKGSQARGSSNGAVKLQLSSGKRKIPVIVLHWSANSRSSNEHGGQLFIYAGNAIGSEEVLTALSLECSSRKQAIRCVNHVDLSLHGFFVDMILEPHPHQHAHAPPPGPRADNATPPRPGALTRSIGPLAPTRYLSLALG